MNEVPFVGLTGGLGSGKSTALAALERLGAATASSDAIVHEIYADPTVVDAVGERFGDAVAPAGTVDRAHSRARLCLRRGPRLARAADLAPGTASVSRRG